MPAINNNVRLGEIPVVPIFAGLRYHNTEELRP